MPRLPLSLIGLLMAPLAIAVPCKLPITYSCLSESSPLVAERCRDNHNEPNGQKPCGKTLELEGICPAEERVSSCEVELLGQSFTMHFYQPAYTQAQAAQDCKVLKGTLCTPN